VDGSTARRWTLAPLALAVPAPWPHGAVGLADEALMMALALALFGGYVWSMRRSLRRRIGGSGEPGCGDQETGVEEAPRYDVRSGGDSEPPAVNKEAP